MRIIEDGPEPYVACSVCGSENVHMSAVRVNTGGEYYQIDGQGLSKAESGAPGRGASITISFYCEAGHIFESTFQFHKGATFVQTKHIGDMPVDEQGAPITPADIWRE